MACPKSSETGFTIETQNRVYIQSVEHIKSPNESFRIDINKTNKKADLCKSDDTRVYTDVRPHEIIASTLITQ